MLLAGSGAALADSCSAIRSQMRVKAGVSTSQIAQIRRQIAAIRAIERKRSCTAEKAAAGGFFNACRSSARQRADAERELAAAQGGGGASLRARYKALGCETATRSHPDQKERLIKPDTPRRSGPKYAGDTIFYCVRPSDGYFFPAPKSQFARKNYPEIAVDQCRFICEEPTMALYVLEDPELETEEMLSVETKTPYRELPTAFRYQANEFEACNWSRYFARVKELKARTVTPGNLKNAIIPAPTFRPGQQDELLTSAYKTEADVESVHRKVRVVGPTFLPDEKIRFREISNREKQRGSLANTVETLIKLR
ncbi:DUF2865 domain-containing protein [Mesorhizobium sp. A623]